MGKNKYCKEITQLVERAEKLGFVDEGLRHGGHIRLRHPNGPVTLPATPGGPASLRNNWALIRRVARGDARV